MSRNIAIVACHWSRQLTIALCKQAFHPVAPISCTTGTSSSVPLPSLQHTSWLVIHPTVMPIDTISRGAKSDEGRQLRLLFSIRFTHGHVIATLKGAIIDGLDHLWEHKGTEVVAGCLNTIWENSASRPELIFYEKGCALRRYRLNHPDDLWLGTLQFVAR